MKKRRIQELAEVMSLLSHQNRIALLYGINNGRSANEIAEEQGVSRQTLQGHIDKLKEGNVIERPTSDDDYRLTPLGEQLLPLIQEIDEEIVAESLKEKAEEQETSLYQRLEELKEIEEAGVGYESPFTDDELEELLDNE